MNCCRAIESICSIARDAGAAIMDIYGREFSVTSKTDASPLTEADTASNAIICAGLAKLYPDIPVLSEENAAVPYEVRASWRRFWLVDPLDGTKEFVSRNGEFTVNIALIDGGRPVLGIVYVPVRDVLYAATEGSGASRCVGGVHEALRPGRPQGAPFRVVASRSHRSAETERYVEALRLRHGDVEFVPAGSSLKFCLVAEGSADCYPRFGPTMEWDTGAGQAVAEMAGCSVTVAGTSEPMRYNKPDLHNPDFIVTSVAPSR